VLTFVGLGLYDEEDVTVKGLHAIENADVVYAEFYSSKLIGTTIEKLEEFYKREISNYSRGVDCHGGMRIDWASKLPFWQIGNHCVPFQRGV
jgi:diphthamide biosynthesis methyltransferase